MKKVKEEIEYIETLDKEDEYFDNKHWKIKLFETLFVIIGWIIVILPIRYVIMSQFFWKEYRMSKYIHENGENVYIFMLVIVLVIFGILALLNTVVYLLTNFYIEKNNKLNLERVNKNNEILEKYFDKKYLKKLNEKDILLNVEENIEDEEILELIKGGNYNEK